MVSKKGFEPSRPKARAPKTLVTAISPLRDKLAYALSMMRLTKQVGGRRYKNYQSKENSLLIIARRPHNSPFSACPFLGCDRRRAPMTGNIPRQGSGLSCRLSQPEAGSLTRFTASIIKHLMLHRKGDQTRRLFGGCFWCFASPLTRFYFSCPKFHHTTRAEYLPHNLWRSICFSI